MSSTKKSIRKTSDQILGVISVKRAERLLCDWANMPDDDPTEIYRRHHRRYFEEVPQLDIEGGYRRMLRLYPEVFPPEKKAQSVRLLRIFGGLLRKAWCALDERHRNWYLADAESTAHRERTWYVSAADPFRAVQIERLIEPSARPTVLEALLYHVRRNTRRLLRCANPDCPAPYFLSSKKGQKYCSPECARPAQLESKRRWWSDYRAQLKEGKEK